MSSTGNIKATLRVECLRELLSHRAYVSLPEIALWFADRNIVVDAETLTKYLFELTREKALFGAGKAWYSKLSEPYLLDRKPVSAIVKLLREEFPNLVVSCWSTEQINRHFNHLLSRFLTFVHVERGYERDVVEFLERKGWRVFSGKVGSLPDPLPTTPKTALLRTLVTRSPSEEGYAEIEKILVDLRLEKYVAPSEVDHACASVVDAYRINLGALLGYAKRRRLSPRDALGGVKSISATFLDKVAIMDSKARPTVRRKQAEIDPLLEGRHLRRVQPQIGGASRQILERCVRALALVTRLSETGMPFLFKGGTCLLLRLKHLNRLSIDVDITTETPAQDLTSMLGDLAASAGFKTISERENPYKKLPLSTFALQYESAWGGTDEIRLDVVHETSLFQHAKKVKVRTAFYDPRHPASVLVPSVDELLADKLTAFAPHTVGIRINVEEPEVLQIAKHLFDIGELFEVANDLAVMRAAHQLIVARQNTYQSKSFTAAQALEDVIESARTLCLSGLPKTKETREMKEFQTGIAQVRDHTIHGFSLPDAKAAASKAALVASVLLCAPNERKLKSWRREKGAAAAVPAGLLAGKLDPLNVLRKTSALAYAYWTDIQGLQSQTTPAD